MLKQKHYNKKLFDEMIGNGVRKLIEDGVSIDWSFYTAMRLNSFEKKLIVPKLTDEALINLVEIYISNTKYPKKLGRYELSTHYEEGLIREILPLLIKRMKKLLGEKEKK